MINWNFIGNYEESYSKPLDFLKFIMVKIYTDFENTVHVILLKIFNCQQQVLLCDFFMQQDMKRYGVIFTHRLINPINT